MLLRHTFRKKFGKVNATWLIPLFFSATAVFDNSVLNSVQRFDQINTLISKILVLGNLAFSPVF